MLRLAPTLSAAALLAVVLAAAVPVGAATMLKVITVQNHVAIGFNEGTTRRLSDDARANAQRLVAVGSLRRYATIKTLPIE